MDSKTKKTLDSASEIYLWMFIENLSVLIWRIKQDLAEGKVEPTPSIEQDLISMQYEIDYSIGQLERFGIKDAQGNGKKKYSQWYKMWGEYLKNLSDADSSAIDKKLHADSSDNCIEFSPYGVPEEMFFGKKLREVRLKSKLGLRKFAEKLKIPTSELSSLEHGYIDPRGDEILLVLIVLALDKLDDAGYQELVKLYHEPFVMKKMPKFDVPFHITKIDGSCATPEEIQNLTDYVNSISEEHNQKADKYNEENGVR